MGPRSPWCLCRRFGDKRRVDLAKLGRPPVEQKGKTSWTSLLSLVAPRAKISRE